MVAGISMSRDVDSRADISRFRRSHDFGDCSRQISQHTRDEESLLLDARPGQRRLSVIMMYEVIGLSWKFTSQGHFITTSRAVSRQNAAIWKHANITHILALRFYISRQALRVRRRRRRDRLLDFIITITTAPIRRRAPRMASQCSHGLSRRTCLPPLSLGTPPPRTHAALISDYFTATMTS